MSIGNQVTLIFSNDFIPVLDTTLAGPCSFPVSPWSLGIRVILYRLGPATKDSLSMPPHANASPHWMGSHAVTIGGELEDKEKIIALMIDFIHDWL